MQVLAPPTQLPASPILGSHITAAVFKGILCHTRCSTEATTAYQPEGKQPFRYSNVERSSCKWYLFSDGELLPSGVVEELYREVSAQTIRNLPIAPTDGSQDGVR